MGPPRDTFLSTTQQAPLMPKRPEHAGQDDDSTGAAPFLRWAGGKRGLARRLVDLAPENAAQRRYVEPFLGAGSLFFALAPQEAILGDANAHLVSCYRHIRDSAPAVASQLRHHAAAHGIRYYYRVRDLYNRTSASPARAAHFIYLNQACFNGVFRVNESGEFNVPIGSKKKPNLPTAGELERVARQLKQAKLVAGDFETTLALAKKGDFVYLDPPYPPLNGTAYFAHYTKDRFAADDQERLAKLVRELDARGCAVMVSNAGLKTIKALYNGFTFKRLIVTRWVTCNKKRHRVREVVITNYQGKGA
jgi:DNA adenine methylase